MAIGPIDTAPLFAPLEAQLVALLRSLTPDEWLRPTVAGHWRVRDVVAHLLDTSLRRVAVNRDGHLLAPDGPITSPADVARLVNGLNATAVAVAARLSTRELVDLVELAGTWLVATLSTLPPHGRAVFAVSWAGEETSENWMDVGREYTERWHHQMQIRDAVGRPLLLEPRWLDPLLDLSVCALPVAYRGIDAPEGTVVRLEVDADEARAWTLTRRRTQWIVDRAGAGGAACTVRLSADAAWRLFYNALPVERARAMTAVSGDATLAEPLFRARSVVL